MNRRRNTFPRNFKTKNHLPPINSSCTEHERWEIKCLPSDWTQPKTPSIILQNYLKRKKEAHEEAIALMKTQNDSIKVQVKDLIAEKVSYVKNDLRTIETEMESIVKQNEYVENKLMLVHNNKFDVSMEALRQLQTVRNEKLDQFYNFLISVQVSKSEALKKIYKQLHTKLYKIAYKTIPELDSYFEDELREANESSLLILRHYTEMMQELSLRYENEMRHKSLLIQSHKDQWYNLLKSELISIHNENALLKVQEGEYLIDLEHAEKAYASFSSQENRLNFLWKHFNPIYLRKRDLKAFAEEVDDTVNKLDACALRMVKMYKIAIKGVFNGYFEGVNTMVNNLIQVGLADDQEIDQVKDEYCSSIVDQIITRFDVDQLNQIWNDVIVELQTKLKTTFCFLLQAGNAWDSHFERLDQVKMSILLDLQQTIDKHSKICQREEAKLNIYIDKLRQAPFEDVDDCLNDVFVRLDNMVKIYQQHYAAEIAVIDKFREFAEVASEIVISELKQILKFHPKEVTLNISKQVFFHPITSSLSFIGDIRDDLIPKQIKMCQYHTQALQNWMFGLREAIENCLDTTQIELKNQAEDWIKERHHRISKRLEVKMSMHQPKYATIKKDIYDVRKATTEDETVRLERHQAGIEEVIETAQKLLVEQEEQFKEIIAEMKEIQQENLVKCKKVKNKVLLQNLILDATFQNNKQLETLEMAIKNLQDTIKGLQLKVKKSQTEYVNSIKMFHEFGGTQHQQGLKLLAKLKTLEKKFNKSYSKIFKAANALEAKYTRSFDAQKTDYSNIIAKIDEEFTFNYDATNIIKESHSLIRKEVYDLRFKIKKSISLCKLLSAKGEEHCGKFEFIENLENIFFQLLENFGDIGTVLLSNSNFLGACNKLLRMEYRSTPSFSQLNKAMMDSGKETFKDYTKLLFEHIPHYDDTYIGNTYDGIYKTFTKVQSLAKEFYSTHPQLVTESIVQKNYDEFIGEVLGKFLLYVVQVDCFWLEEAVEFVGLIKVMEDIIKDFVPKFIRRYNAQALKKIIGCIEDAKDDVIKLRGDLRSKFQSLHSKVKIYLGHPLKGEILEQVDKEIISFLDVCPTILDETIAPWKEKIDDLHKKNILELSIMQETLNRVLKSMYHTQYTASMTELIKKKFEYLQNLKDYSRIPSGLSIPEFNATSLLMEYKNQMPDPTDFMTKFDNLNRVSSLKRREYYTSEMSTHSHLYVQSVGDISGCYKEVMRELSHLDEECLEDFEKWRAIWESGKRAITSLFKVKYDYPPELE